MIISLASDHRGFELKEQVKSWLETKDLTVEDLGTNSSDSVDYPSFALKLAASVAANPADNRGIGICGSGAGMDVIANKVNDIRASLIHNPDQVAAARADDNINVLILGSDFIDFDSAKKVITVFLETKFTGAERHRRRLDQIEKYEKNNNS